MTIQSLTLSKRKISNSRKKTTKSNPSKAGQPKISGQKSRSRCGRCRAIPEHTRRNCPAAQSVCRGCGIKGHWQKFCLLGKDVHDLEEDDYCDEDAYLGTIEEVESSSPLYISLKIKNENIRFKIDTGADLTVIPEDVFH